MSAILQDVSALTGTNTAVEVDANITVNFNSDLTLPANKRFTFTLADGTVITDNVFRVADDVTSVTVNLTLTMPPDDTEEPPPPVDEVTLEFATPSVFFGISPPGQTAPAAPTPAGEGTELAFTLPAPPHFFTPWAFQLSINGTIGNTPVNGIAAPTFFISRNSSGPNSQSATLIYNSDNGGFTIDNSLALGQTPLLTNTVFPLNVTLTLQGAAGFPGSDLTQAILWNSGEQPDWISATPGTSQVSGTKMNFTIAGDAKGQGAGFRFAINLGSNGPVINSPDPILVNATIGDG